MSPAGRCSRFSGSSEGFEDMAAMGSYHHAQ